MADEPENHTLAYLRRMDAKLDRVIQELADLKVRQNETNRFLLGLRRDQVVDAETAVRVEARVDALNDRVNRIERRLDIVD